MRTSTLSRSHCSVRARVLHQVHGIKLPSTLNGLEVNYWGVFDIPWRNFPLASGRVRRVIDIIFLACHIFTILGLPMRGRFHLKGVLYWDKPMAVDIDHGQRRLTKGGSKTRFPTKILGKVNLFERPDLFREPIRRDELTEDPRV